MGSFCFHCSISRCFRWRTGIPELNENTIKFLGNSLDLKEQSDEKAKKFLEKKLYDSLYAVSTKVNFAIHIVANG